MFVEESYNREHWCFYFPTRCWLPVFGPLRWVAVNLFPTSELISVHDRFLYDQVSSHSAPHSAILWSGPKTQHHILKKPASVWIMDWCRTVTRHYLSQGQLGLVNPQSAPHSVPLWSGCKNWLLFKLPMVLYSALTDSDTTLHNKRYYFKNHTRHIRYDFQSQ